MGQPPPIVIEPDPDAMECVLRDLSAVASASSQTDDHTLNLPGKAGRIACRIEPGIRQSKLHLTAKCWSGAEALSTTLALPLNDEGTAKLRHFVDRSSRICNLVRITKLIACNASGYEYRSQKNSFRFNLPHGHLRMFKGVSQNGAYFCIQIEKSAGGNPETLTLPTSTVLQMTPDKSDPEQRAGVCADGSIAAFLQNAFDKLPNPNAEKPPIPVLTHGQPKRVQETPVMG